MEPCQQLFPRGLRKIVNFRGGSTKNSEFPRGSSGKPFLIIKGSKISNLVNRGVWILLNGMARFETPPPHLKKTLLLLLNLLLLFKYRYFQYKTLLAGQII